ncbi:MAG: methylmalonyl-CoA epimerase [Betaproteobacteria bacterium RIFCSPLOWO2_02_FULL_63_19]|nr:MAG: methylmalonyl-CoA epimerase [Betaproteobacteria bacterium RIFCSPLOWO2_02_FULL_63_19]
MITKISHIGIAVENLDAAKKFFEENFSLPATGNENFGELLFSFVGFEGEATALELLQSTTDEGQMAKFIAKRGPGIHHVALETDDIQAELDRLHAKGIQLINQKPYRNAHDELVAFIHPKSTGGVLIELVQR